MKAVLGRPRRSTDTGHNTQPEKQADSSIPTDSEDVVYVKLSIYIYVHLPGKVRKKSILVLVLVPRNVSYDRRVGFLRLTCSPCSSRQRANRESSTHQNNLWRLPKGPRAPGDNERIQNRHFLNLLYLSSRSSDIHTHP